ncbi:MAG TPA: heavy metal transport/detoxification protein [Betaproteobacteria bacterium]|nr:heavy metal transport/detoxification protein [Betaproteobacteria bacterium]
MQTTKLSVTGMTCGHCVAAVAKALEKVPGVESAKVNLEQGQTVIEGEAVLQALIEAVREEGYGAQLHV